MKRIFCYGDSNTFGHDPKDGSRLAERWPKVLSSLLGSEYEIIEAGLCGRTSAFDDPFTEGMNGRAALAPTLWSAQPVDLVIIMLGTNDLQLKHHLSPEEIAGGVETLLKFTENPEAWDKKNAKTLLISPIHLDPNIGNSPMGFGDIFGGIETYQKSLALAPLLKALAEKYHVHFMNAADYAEPSPIDCLHMDEENHHKLAVAIEQKIHTIL